MNTINYLKELEFKDISNKKVNKRMLYYQINVSIILVALYREYKNPIIRKRIIYSISFSPIVLIPSCILTIEKFGKNIHGSIFLLWGLINTILVLNLLINLFD